MGCLVQRYYDDLVKELPEVDLFIKIDEYPEMWQKIEKLINEDIVEKSKEKVRQLTHRLISELDGFLADIQHQEKLIRGIDDDIDKLQNEIMRCEDTRNWLKQLETDIKGA